MLPIIVSFAILAERSVIGQTAKEIEAESENQKEVIQYFYEHDMPARAANDRNTKFTAYHVKKEMHGTPMLTTAMVNDSLACKGNTYLIELEFTVSTMKYLYCMNKSIKLLSVYELKNDRWVKVKKK